jgi:hypothetical protein
VRIFRPTGSKQPLPFRRTGKILNVRSITVGERPLFYKVVPVAVWTFDVKAGCGHSEEAIADILPVLKQAEVGVPVVELFRKVGISDQMFYRWKAKYVGPGVQ